MKYLKFLFLVLSVVLLLVACQDIGLGGSLAITPAPESPDSYPAPALPASPSEFSSYPPSNISSYPVPVVPSVLYPDAKDGDEVSWDQAIGLIYNDEVTQVTQTHDLKVFLTLKDGRTLVTLQPVIDEVIKVIEKCGEKCKNIRIASE